MQGIMNIVSKAKVRVNTAIARAIVAVTSFVVIITLFGNFSVAICGGVCATVADTFLN